jgi:hypothetical protein
MLRRGIGALVLLAATVAFAGCGDDRLSADEFRKQATKICTDQRKLTDRISTPKQPGDVASFLQRGLRVVRPALAKLEKLKPPKDLDERYKVTLDALTRQLRLIEGGYGEVKRGADPIEIFDNLGPRLTPLRQEADRSWAVLNLQACVNQ